MTSHLHDALQAIFRYCPEFAVFLLASVGYPVPAGVAVLGDSYLPAGEGKGDGKSRPRTGDAVVTVRRGRRVVLAIATEVQTSKPSMRQRRRQHGYLANAGTSTTAMPCCWY